MLCVTLGSAPDSPHPVWCRTGAGSVRRNGSFIYEEFLATGGTDVKVRAGLPWHLCNDERHDALVSEELVLDCKSTMLVSMLHSEEGGGPRNTLAERNPLNI